MSVFYALGAMTGVPVGAWAAHEFSWSPFQRFVTAPTATARTDMVGIMSALHDYAENNGGTFPDSLEPLFLPDENGERYLDQDSVPVDPWGRPYEYRREVDPAESFVLACYGADGVPGGKGTAADILSPVVKARGGH